MLAKEKRRLDAKHLDLGQQLCPQSTLLPSLHQNSNSVPINYCRLFAQRNMGGGRTERRLGRAGQEAGETGCKTPGPGPQSTTLPAVNAFVDILSLQSCINPHQNID